MSEASGPRVWVDADATPRPVKEMLYKAAMKRGVHVTLVANRWLQIPQSTRIELQVVGQGFDLADEHIVAQVQAGDLVVTADVPLAAAAVDKGATCVDPRGEVIDADNARARLAMRDFMEQMRESGQMTGGPPPYADKDKHRFASVLDRWITAR